MVLENWGWNEHFRSHLESKQSADTRPEHTRPEHTRPGHTRPGRVVTQSHQLYRIMTEEGMNWGRVTGVFRNNVTSVSEYPVVGDWVLVETGEQHTQWPIHAVLERKSAFSRKAAGVTTEEQILAANIDYLFIVNGLDGGRNFNLRGLERYLACAWESGATPVIILNKVDLCSDPKAAVSRAEDVALGVDVHTTSCRHEDGLGQLQRYLRPGRTVALVGRSGVGKSSIINILLGDDVQATQKSRSTDKRGRHTTSSRQLFKLPSGAMLIDTPGLRELQLWGEETVLGDTFPEVEELAVQCRFRNCSHVGEPGCMVSQALAEGRLDRERFQSYLNHQRELKYLKSKQDVRLQMEKKERGKAIAKLSRALKKRRG